MKTIIIMGSTSDEPHAKKITISLMNIKFHGNNMQHQLTKNL